MKGGHWVRGIWIAILAGSMLLPSGCLFASAPEQQRPDSAIEYAYETRTVGRFGIRYMEAWRGTAVIVNSGPGGGQMLQQRWRQLRVHRLMEHNRDI